MEIATKNSTSEKPDIKWLTTNVFLLGMISFFADLSGEMMTPILPLFIVSIGGTGFIIGFIGGLGDAVANFVKVFSGYLADRIGRRRGLILSGYGIPFFAKLGIGFSSSWDQVAVLKPVERLGKGIRGAPRDSLLADSTEAKFLGKTFGFHRMMDTAGAVMGSFVTLVLVILLFDLLGTELAVLQFIIIVAAFVSLLAVFPIIFLKEPVKSAKRKLRKTSITQNLKDLPRNYYKFLIITTIFNLANFTVLLFVLQARNVIPQDESELVKIVIPVALFMWFSVIYTVLSMPFGSWSDKRGRKTVYAIGMILFIVTCGGFLFATDLLLLLTVFAIYGAFNAATDGIQKAYTVDLVPEDLKGTGLGLLQTLSGFATVIAGVIAGFLMDIDPSLTFFYGGTVAFIALLLLLASNVNPLATDPETSH